MSEINLIPSVVALIVLSLLAFWLVRRAKISRWLALLLVAVPLVAGNMAWLHWIQPQQQLAARLDAAQQQLATMLVYRTIKQQDPALYKQLNDELVISVRNGAETDKAIAQLRPMLADLLNQRVGRAQDSAVIDYIRMSVRQMQSLRQLSGELCFQFLFPQLSGEVNTIGQLPPQLQQQDLQQMDALLAASTGPEISVDLPVARQSMQGIVRTLYEKWGSKLQMLNAPTDIRVDHNEMCDMTIDLYQAILALPPKQAANVLRMMLGASGG
ncbi:hypothetical protein [Erwinia sp. V71]|uniref:hypothetical protein n=1 Tax=Erwinia sp. V71 TaxID=3369424 RepID=UPI003F6239A8